jgi:isoleucyl-tRNA synthetase
MNQKYNEYKKLDLSKVAKEVLKKWELEKTFEQSLEVREGKQNFIFYEGPPSANGQPGIHHVMARAIKDIFCRYKTQKGFFVKRKGGWDTHGLPIELNVEKSLGITKEDIGKKITVSEYNAACRSEVMKYKDMWDDLTQKMGYWVDLSDPYITFKNEYIESLWYLLSEIYKKGWLYKGYTIQPYSPAAGTGLSSHELNLPGCYKDVKDTTCVAQFKAKYSLNLPQGDLAKVWNRLFKSDFNRAYEEKLYNTANSLNYEILKENAKNRKKNPTEAEDFLWKNLQNKQLDGYKFCREHIIGDFIADFVCLPTQLIIEIDGEYHNEKNQKEYDQVRTEYLNQKGFRVIRFTNNEILNDIEKTLETIKLALHQSHSEGDLGGCYFLAWTTTPWTLPSNTALAVGQNIDYLCVETFNQYSGQRIMVILAKALLNNFFPEKNVKLKFEDYKLGDKNIPFRIFAEAKGSELIGIEYEQLIPWVNPGEGAFRIISGDYVTTEDGTGIVHIAPTFGADDDRVAKQSGVQPLFVIDTEGKRQPMVDRCGKFYQITDLDSTFVKEKINVDLYAEFSGRFVKNEFDPTLTEEDKTLDVDLAVMLKMQNKAFKIEKYVHNYPHCWRTNKPVLYYPLDSWFIRTTALKDRMIALNRTINWKPEATGTGRFGNWLENLVDWNLSRSRYWGTPLPIWRTEDGTEEICIGSIAQLSTEIDKSIEAGFMKENTYKSDNYDDFDLHRPYIDNVFLVSPSGKKMTRELDLIDVWFDSGAMPYAQMHYPFESN